MSKIIVIGSSNTDMVVKTAQFPAPGETILGGEFFMFSGGKGANQAVASARTGGDVLFICKTGNDIFGRSAITAFQQEGINTKHVSIDPVKASGVAMITVDANGENEIVVAPGANNELSESDIKAAESEIISAEIILMQLEVPVNTVLFAAQLATHHHKKVILNPAPATQLPNELFKHLYLLTPNETEAEILTGIKVADISSAASAAGKLLELGVLNVIITMGSAGAYFKNKEIEMMIDAPLVKAVDSTAAGDVFNGVLATELTMSKDWKTAISTACKAASISVTRMGAQASMPYRNELISTDETR
jgi:ribokinase